MDKINVKITIFSTDTCTKCKMLKNYLTSKWIEFRDLNALDNWNILKDTWFASAPIIRVEIEWQDDIWFWEVENFINYLDDDGVCVQA